MLIILFMAGDAGGRRTFEVFIYVTGLAFHNAMLPYQRECSQAVINPHFRPELGIVATIAFLTQPAFVRILIPVTGHASHVELVLVQIAFVAALAADFSMPAQKRKLGHAAMIKTAGFPGTRGMA